MSTHIIELDDYEVANLRSAIEAIGYPYRPDALPNNPLGILNTGDWIGQLYWKLPKVEHRPNVEPSELVERARQMARWMVEGEQAALE